MCPFASSGEVLRVLGSKGPGAIVFILCSRGPDPTVLGLLGAYIGFDSFIPPYDDPNGVFLTAGFDVGNGGNAQSKFDDIGSGDGGPYDRLGGGISGLPKGDCRPPGVMGDPVREGPELAGVN